MIGMTEAAKRTGKTRQTIHKAIRQGKLSAQKDRNGEWRIDPSELFRVYPPVSESNVNKTSKVDAGLRQISDGLQRENALLRARLQDKDEIIGELRNDRDHWRQQATALLTDSRKRGFLSSLLGKN
jgi:excisionase family DNA binding protein